LRNDRDSRGRGRRRARGRLLKFGIWAKRTGAPKCLHWEPSLLPARDSWLQSFAVASPRRSYRQAYQVRRKVVRGQRRI